MLYCVRIIRSLPKKSRESFKGDVSFHLNFHFPGRTAYRLYVNTICTNILKLSLIDGRINDIHMTYTMGMEIQFPYIALKYFISVFHIEFFLFS